MTAIALFHSVLGPRPGFLETAERLRSEGHTVHVLDQYDGQVFDDYEPAMEFMEGIGFHALLEMTRKATADLPDGFVAMGFSLGGVMAEYVAGRRPGVSGVVTFGGAVSPEGLGITWPEGIDAQVHTTVDDPRREQEEIDGFRSAVERAGGRAEVYD